jgi:hypothetical protein
MPVDSKKSMIFCIGDELFMRSNSNADIMKDKIWYWQFL